MRVDIAGLRGEFSVFVIDSDPSAAHSLTETLKAAGYSDVKSFHSLDMALAEANELLPHMVVLDFLGFGSAGERFLMDLAGLSSEILSILTVEAQKHTEALTLVGRQLAYDVQIRPIASSLELIQKLDRGLARLYFQFENEQLKEELSERHEIDRLKFQSLAAPAPHQSRGPISSISSSSSSSSALSSALSSASAAAPQDVNFHSDLTTFLERISGTKDVEQSLLIFLEQLSSETGGAPALWLKYMPSHMYLMVHQAVKVPAEKFRGVGVDLRKENPARLSEMLKAPEQIEALRALVRDVFRSERFMAFPLLNETNAVKDSNDSEPAGVFVVLVQDGHRESGNSVSLGPQAARLAMIRRIFEIAYKRNVTLKEKHILDVADSLTGLFNRRHFSTRLEEEIARARRILMPLSLITLDLDRTHEFNERIGFQQTDALIKTIGAILKKTARTNDIVARVGSDEFAILLPHTPHMGAAVKAERMRRIIEATKFPLLDSLGLRGPTVSCGVSEYPSFSSDGESLLRTADEAMLEVKRANGNRVCLALPPVGFKMDFAPRTTPEDAGNRRSGGRS